MILLIWSACLVGLALGVIGGFGSGVVGDWVYRRSELLVLRSAEGAPNGVEPGFGYGYGQGALEYTARKGMTWAEKPASAYEDESDGSDGGAGPEGRRDDQWLDQLSPTTATSPAYAGRPSSSQSGGNGSYTSSRPGRGSARRRSTADSVGSFGPESPMERKGSLSSGKSPRPGMPKKKVTFDGKVEEK